MSLSTSPTHSTGLTAGPYAEESTARTIEVDGVRIHYHEAGSGDPLICLNAWGEGMTSWFTYHRNLEAFAEHYRVLLVDPIHSGRSLTPATLDGSAEVDRATINRYLAGFMDALNITRAPLIGTSTGGTTALLFALTYPDRVTRLVLSGCGISNGDNALLFNPVFYDDDGQIVVRQEGIKLGLAAITDPTRENIARMLREGFVFRPESIQSEHIDHLVAVSSDPELRADREDTREAFFSASYQHRSTLPDLPRFTTPTLFFHGRYDIVVSPEVALAAVSLIPNCRTVFLRCGNLVPFEQPEDFNQITLGFLQQA
ncbi:alpha/beta fold hydrolase [Nocardia sp. R7R-8]|uniref:alpha/beta fold hydrolase n=1 Tax=Nocardia sp. R7R-8 TaxID=3459304 RepID=UPI00403D69DF